MNHATISKIFIPKPSLLQDISLHAAIILQFSLRPSPRVNDEFKQ
jgi:hypothetical protein